ncbi:hypothetical protein LEP1GSC016_1582 [Leptospira borgpetersenii serovar Hardjo-bovis str. Sponselee]|uniref:Uncharacterized protein n=2 Tax=Leptospira borgpetersenii TaxID=174 RepID=M6BTW0_LEPBO|nr:hypothetical protein LEP1GSC101_4026 [Leptospira borgpetersenii str. UI 09149]EMJ82954.1 hypothetical protein LEP1GSC016_1582 [Leptospira borgpetersenii serovar Hardjo-bovis str. Sponselee]EMN57024.1 hypothetical protein LEP1GSC090_0837 [Leptospira borgpetersenii serovar Javanica str. MK146]EPG56696.1 hypothetical protein LEP1GSC103_1888 [Leptospira borgpetersenii serovar Javanica str. UI 09931]
MKMKSYGKLVKVFLMSILYSWRVVGCEISNSNDSKSV